MLSNLEILLDEKKSLFSKLDKHVVLLPINLQFLYELYVQGVMVVLFNKTSPRLGNTEYNYIT